VDGGDARAVYNATAEARRIAVEQKASPCLLLNSLSLLAGRSRGIGRPSVIELLHCWHCIAGACWQIAGDWAAVGPRQGSWGRLLLSRAGGG
jgi:hypothetical protein